MVTIGALYSPEITKKQYSALFVTASGFVTLLFAGLGYGSSYPLLTLLFVCGFVAIGALSYSITTGLSRPAGVANDGIMLSGVTNRGLVGWIIGLLLTAFYIVWYWWPDIFVHWYRMTDPISEFLRGRPSDQWFFYGFFYTYAIVIMGVRALIKYRHNRYHQVRTSVIMAAQLILAFLIPALLVYFKQPEKYLNYSWPLSYKDFFPSEFIALLDNPAKLSLVLLIWGIAFTFVLTPILTYYFGKRWYCSWVCGCGGLANTAGDPWRHLSSKTARAWSIERVSIYSVLMLIVITTGFLWVSYITGWGHSASTVIAEGYGFFIGSVFSGVIGVGLYPLLGARVWCRFGCPMAGILGILQKFNSRFRITTNGAQCISCGNCSTYCEMGIDVREYAQQGKNIVRASCVGCGICATVCPRGVLSLENGPRRGRENSVHSLINTVKSGAEID